ncbi:MAG: 50S ribosomal protein L15 [Armatimonadota bacterium]
MRLNDLSPAPGSHKERKRVGRGIGSGHGRTCGRGTKGQKARNKVRMGFEGGQTPLHRRIPHRRGFKNPFRDEYAVVNLNRIAKLTGVTEVTPELLLERGLIKDPSARVKILGTGELTAPLVIRAHSFSKSAIEKIQKVGGTVEVI